MSNQTFPYIKRKNKEFVYLTTEKINEIAKNLYENCFHEPFYGEVVWSSRMKKIAGNCRSDGRIALNKNYYINYGKTETIKILKHELVHLYCFKCVGKHSHKDIIFLENLDKIGGAIKGKPLHEKMYVYQCPSCQKKWFFTEKLKEPLCCKVCSSGTYNENFLIKYIKQVKN